MQRSSLNSTCPLSGKLPREVLYPFYSSFYWGFCDTSAVLSLGLLLSSWCCLFWPGLSLCSTLCRAWATYLEDCARFEPGDERVHTGYGEVSVVLKCS